MTDAPSRITLSTDELDSIVWAAQELGQRLGKAEAASTDDVATTSYPGDVSRVLASRLRSSDDGTAQVLTAAEIIAWLTPCYPLDEVYAYTKNGAVVAVASSKSRTNGNDA